MSHRGMIARAGLVAVAIVACALPARAQAQWTQTAGPQGAVVTALAASDRAVYAAVYDDVYRYDDARSRWVRSGSLEGHMLQFGSLGGPRMLLAGDDLLATTREGIILSSDGGATWTPTGIEGSLFVGDGTVHAISGERIHRWIDGAWREVGTVPTMTALPVVAAGAAFTTTLYGSDLFRSDDGMRSWRQVELSLPSQGREATAGMGVMLASGGDVLYASLGGAEIFRSRDGASWENITGTLPELLGARELHARGEDLLINTNHGLYRFDGTAWDSIDSRPVREVAFAGERTLLATYGGLRVVEEDGTTTSLDGGLISSGAWSLAAIGPYVLASTLDGMQRTTDGGASWHQVADVTPCMSAGIAEVRGTLIAAAGVLYRSLDSGATWTMTGPEYDFEWEGPPYRNDITGLAADGEFVYAAAGSYLTGKGASGWASGGVFRSNDRGGTWQEVSNNLPHDGFTHVPVGSVVATDGHVVIATARGLYRSDDGGVTWRPSMSGLPAGSRYTGHIELFSIGTSHFARVGTEFFESSDGGRSWRAMPAMPEGYSWSGGSASNVDGKLYTVASRVVDDTSWSLRLMRFDGRGWEDVSHIVPDGVTFQSLVRAGSYLYAGTMRHGVWRTSAPSGPSSIASSDAAALSRITAAPSPTLGDATVSFELPERSALVLRLVDARGGVVRSIDLGVLDAGSRSVRVPMSDLAAGVYFVRVDGPGWSIGSPVVKASR